LGADSSIVGVGDGCSLKAVSSFSSSWGLGVCIGVKIAGSGLEALLLVALPTSKSEEASLIKLSISFCFTVAETPDKSLRTFSRLTTGFELNTVVTATAFIFEPLLVITVAGLAQLALKIWLKLTA